MRYSSKLFAEMHFSQRLRTFFFHLSWNWLFECQSCRKHSPCPNYNSLKLHTALQPVTVLYQRTQKGLKLNHSRRDSDSLYVTCKFWFMIFKDGSGHGQNYSISTRVKELLFPPQAQILVALRLTRSWQGASPWSSQSWHLAQRWHLTSWKDSSQMSLLNISSPVTFH